MSDGQGKVAGVPIAAFVKGGTPSAQWTEERRRLKAESEARRAHQDRQMAAVVAARGKPWIATALLSKKLLSRTSPKIILKYAYNDEALSRYCVCEIARVAHPTDPSLKDHILTLVCPRCLEREGSMSDGQTMIRSSQRPFYVREAKELPLERRRWQDPDTGSIYLVYGTVTTHDAISCDGRGCNWRFRIDDSVLREV